MSKGNRERCIGKVDGGRIYGTHSHTNMTYRPGIRQPDISTWPVTGLLLGLNIKKQWLVR